MIDCVVEGDPKPTIQWDKNLKMNDFDKTRFVYCINSKIIKKRAILINTISDWFNIRMLQHILGMFTVFLQQICGFSFKF